MHIIQTHTRHIESAGYGVGDPSLPWFSCGHGCPRWLGNYVRCRGALVSSQAQREREGQYHWYQILLTNPFTNQTMQILHLNTPKESWMKMNMPNHPLYRVDSNVPTVYDDDNWEFSYLKFRFWDLFLNVSGVVSSDARWFFQFSLGKFSDGRKPFSAKGKIFNICLLGFSRKSSIIRFPLFY